jgi:MFS family permease
MADVAVTEAKELPTVGSRRELVDPKGLTRLFWGIFAVQIWLNFDSGAVAATLFFISEDFALEPVQQGLLGGLVYIGLTFMSPLSGYLLQHFHARWVMSFSLATNVVMCFCFLFAWDQNTLLFTRLGVGISQASIIIYTPVWTDEFSPLNAGGAWLSILQAAAPLGVMLGYLIGGFVVDGGYDWRVPFVVQLLFLTPLLLVSFFIPHKYVDALYEEEPEFTVKNTPGPALVERPKRKGRQKSLSEGDTTKGGDKGENHQALVSIEESATRDSGSDSSMVSLDDTESFSCIDGATATTNMGGTSKIVKTHSAPTRRSKAASAGTSGDFDLGHAQRKRVDSIVQYNFIEEGGEHGLDTEEGGIVRERLTITHSLKQLLHSPIFISCTLSLAALYFVVTGVQFWITEYLLITLNIPYATVLAGFTIVSATGPVSGVVFGGWIVDRLGGYKGLKGNSVSSKLCLSFAFMAAGFALPAGFTSEFYLMIFLVWATLFFGGAIVPVATGLVLAAVPAKLRSFSSAMSMLVYNIGGYALGTVLPGVWMQYLNGADPNKSRERILAWGMRLILMWAGFGLFFIAMAAFFAHQNMHRWDAKATKRRGPGEGTQNRRRSSLSFLNADNPDDAAEAEFDERFERVSNTDVEYEMNRRQRASTILAPPPSKADFDYMITMIKD